MSLAVQLTELRGDFRTGLADIKGSLQVLVERSERQATDIDRERAEREAGDRMLGERLDEIEREQHRQQRTRWQAPGLASVAAVAGGAAALWDALRH